MTIDQRLAREARPHAREGWALTSLTVGLVTGPVGLLLGWWLTATSNFWTIRQKFLAAFAVPIPLAIGAGIIVYTVLNFTMEDDPPYIPPWLVALIWIGFFSLFFVPVGLVVHLSRAANRRAMAQVGPGSRQDPLTA
jgi:hypothetical protein